MTPGYTEEQARVAFENKFVPEPNTGCWLWTASQDLCGYGRMAFNGRNQSTHRIAWQLYRGPIPDNLCVCHQCDTPSCVNPEHLFLVDMRVNMNNCADKKRFKNSRKTECRRGHSLVGDNLRIYYSKYHPRGRRECITCARAADSLRKRMKTLIGRK